MLFRSEFQAKQLDQQAGQSMATGQRQSMEQLRQAKLVQSREIASNKMFLIHEILGEDAKIVSVSVNGVNSSRIFFRVQKCQ